MKNYFVHGLVILSIFVALPGCAVEDAVESEETSQDAAAAQPLEAQRGPNICFQPIIIGPCRALIRRYAYDRVLGRCRSFNYGGCQGNENNFTSLAACQRTCGRMRGLLRESADPKEPVLTTPVHTGRGRSLSMQKPSRRRTTTRTALAWFTTWRHVHSHEKAENLCLCWLADDDISSSWSCSANDL